MSHRCPPLYKRAFWTLLLSSLPLEMALAAGENCAAFNALPSVLEVAQGAQKAMGFPVNISRIAVGDPPLPIFAPMGQTLFCSLVLPRAPPA